MAEPADVFLARNLGRISRQPERPEPEHLLPLADLDAMFAEMVMKRLEDIDHFTATELEFFEEGERESATVEIDLDGLDSLA